MWEALFLRPFYPGLTVVYNEGQISKDRKCL